MLRNIKYIDNGRKIRMDMLQNAIGVAATTFLVLALCSGVKAACRKILKRNVEHNIVLRRDCDEKSTF